MKNSKNCFLSATIDRLEDGFAVIRTDNRREIIWPKEKLPEGTGEGEAVRLFLVTSESDRRKNSGAARKLLGRILRQRF